MSTSLQAGQLGVALSLELEEDGEPFDLTGATLTIYLTGPGGQTRTRSGTAASPATAGIVSYTTVAGDFDQVGAWEVQVVATYSASVIYKSQVFQFQALKNLAGDR